MIMGYCQTKSLRVDPFLIFIVLLFILFAAGCSSATSTSTSTNSSRNSSTNASPVDPDETILRFEQAVESKNVSEWMKLATSMDKMYELTEKDAQAYIDYFHKNKDIWRLELRRLDAMAAGKDLSPQLLESSILHLTYSEGRWSGRGEYKIGIQPSYIMISTDYKDTEIYLNGEWHTTASVNDYFGVIGPLEPGEYTLLAKYESGLSVFTSNEEKVVLPAAESPKVHLKIQAEVVRFDSNYPQADLYINGKHTGMTIAEANVAGQLLSTDGTVQAQAKLKQQDRMLESEPVVIDGSSSYYWLELPLEFVQLSASISGSQLYVNDTATDHIVYFDRESEYGPFGAGTVVRFHGEVDSPWGILKSHSHTVNIEEEELAYAYLSYRVSNENLRQSIENALIGFMLNGFDAVQFGNQHRMDYVMDESRDHVFSVLSDSIDYLNASIVALKIHTDSAEVFGSVNKSVIETLSVAPLYAIVTFEYLYEDDEYFSWDVYWEDYAEPIYVEDVRVFSLLMDYNVDLDVWEVDVLEDITYQYYFPEGENDVYHMFR